MISARRHGPCRSVELCHRHGETPAEHAIPVDVQVCGPHGAAENARDEPGRRGALCRIRWPSRSSDRPSPPRNGFRPLPPTVREHERSGGFRAICLAAVGGTSDLAPLAPRSAHRGAAPWLCQDAFEVAPSGSATPSGGSSRCISLRPWARARASCLMLMWGRCRPTQPRIYCSTLPPAGCPCGCAAAAVALRPPTEFGVSSPSTSAHLLPARQCCCRGVCPRGGGHRLDGARVAHAAIGTASGAVDRPTQSLPPRLRTRQRPPRRP